MNVAFVIDGSLGEYEIPVINRLIMK